MKSEVINGIFFGETLCDKREDQRLEELGLKVEKNEYWLPICIDLREIASIRQRGMDGEEAEWTVMEGIAPDVIYTVRTPMLEIKPHFIESRK